MSELITREHDGILVVKLQDVRLIDELVIQDLGISLINLLNESKLDKMLLNFENVRFMASSMLGKLNILRKKAIAEKNDLRICCLTENIREVFQLMKLDSIFEIYPSEEDAFKGFQRHKKKWYV